MNLCFKNKIKDTDKLLQGEVQADAMAMELIHTFRDL